MNSAYFVPNPRTIADLLVSYPLDQARPYVVIRRVVLAGIDYENFITDMRVSRDFLAAGAGTCADREPLRCLLVSRQVRRGAGGDGRDGGACALGSYQS